MLPVPPPAPAASPSPAAPPAPAIKRRTVRDIASRKGQTPLVVLTSYTATMARLADPHVDILLVGDSVGMVVYGFDSTLPVTLDMMVAHGAAVVRSSRQAMVVIDMPFGSYQESPQQAFRNASRLLTESGAAAVKLEGGTEMAETIRFLAERGVPVMGHVGLTPQHFNTLGGFRSQGRSEAEADKIRKDAAAIAEAGAFAIVIEGVVESLGRELTAALPCPTIGIGASPACDGQVLVIDDMLGLFSEFTPKFVKRFATLAPQVDAAVASYADEVRNRHFPADIHCFGVGKQAVS